MGIDHYRIAWKNTVTGLTGNGEYCFTAMSDATSWVEQLNLKHPEIQHWIEEWMPDLTNL